MQKKAVATIIFIFLLAASLAAQPAGQVLERVVAWVDDEPVMLTELEEALVQYQSDGTLAPGPTTEENLRAALKRYINEKLILRQAKKQGIKVEPEELDNRVDALIERLAERNGGIEAFNAAISARGITPVVFRQRLREQMEQEWMIARALSGRISITDEEVRDFVAQREAEGKPVKRYALTHAFLTVAPEAGTEAWDEAEADLYMLLAKARRKGDFTAEVVAWAKARTKEGGEAGSLGIVSPDELDPALAKALEKLKEGESTEPVRTDRGVHVLHLQRITTPREILHAERYREARKEWVTKLRRDASIQTVGKILK
jgi:peptidyl-prolyl cis-trans isomerase SurA